MREAADETYVFRESVRRLVDVCTVIDLSTFTAVVSQVA